MLPSVIGGPAWCSGWFCRRAAGVTDVWSV